MVSPAGHPTQSPQPLSNVTLLLQEPLPLLQAGSGLPSGGSGRRHTLQAEGNATSAQNIKLPLKAGGLKEETSDLECGTSI